ncbi:MAG: protein kinase [Anaerolineales bacterium]|nr:MAG: protein kinase [Anaerolineales bacterium]
METLPLDGIANSEDSSASLDATGLDGSILTRGAILQERYEIVKVLGLGGMGAVYQARDLRFTGVSRLCAIKEMVCATPNPRLRRVAIQTFEREANILASLNHPAIPKIYDYFVEGTRGYLALEYIEGETLEALMESAEEVLSQDKVIDWAIQICEVLSYLHSQDPPLIFRDMKPCNVMLRRNNQIVLIDFGIARVFEAGQRGTMVGTEGYSPPEQYRGIASPQGDIYALGATLHHLLTRRDPRLEPPFTFHKELPRQLNPAISERLEAVIMKAVDYEPEKRYRNAEEMKVALAQCLRAGVRERGRFRAVNPLSAIKQLTIPKVAIRRLVVIITLLILVLAGAGGYYFAQQQRRPVAQAQDLVDNFRETSSPDERLSSLAGLFNLPGHKSQAQKLFYEELAPADQLALFDPANPQAVAEQLVTVVKGVYTAPNLENNERNNLLLVAMAQPLPQLGHSPSLAAGGLELEMKQWLKGREHYNGQGEYQQAIEAYDLAISINNRNPGTYFDRGLAHAAHGDPSRALADFVTTLSLDESWQERVQQALIKDTLLYRTVWDDQEQFGPLVALVPTPTNTPTSTAMPSPTRVPSDTPRPPTFTSTAQPTPTQTVQPTPTSTVQPTPTLTSQPTPSPTATASFTATPSPSLTAGVPSGTFTLLNPLSLDPPSYGPTEFEWEWTGDVPQGFGFEVRVWREGESPAGAHNAVLDNQNGNIEQFEGDKYRLNADIAEAAGVQGRSGIYLWSVSLVQIRPQYADLGLQADPARLRFEVAGAGGDDGGGGGGVGID